jgi:hypothetical protein
MTAAAALTSAGVTGSLLKSTTGAAFPGPFGISTTCSKKNRPASCKHQIDRCRPRKSPPARRWRR